jgi:hypothetical protein
MKTYSQATTDQIEQLKLNDASPVEWLAAKAAYEAFWQATAEWMPALARQDWDTLSVHIRAGWLAAARAAKH